MNIYLVGGAVRDELLAYPFHEKDWVVVGSSPQEMLDAGYLQVGKDFPVFLHPKTKEEHALARTERKTASGYKGFEVFAHPSVTLEQDLVRRDLTINAIAKDKAGNYIDPYNGIADIKNKIFRHVSDAFAEDPVRILRIARFMARYVHLGFSIAPDTMDLMKKMVNAGEVNALVAERVWQEMQKALSEKTPTAFITTLRDCGALKVILPELDCLWGVPQPEIHHPEIDTGLHTLMVLEQACSLSDNPQVRFSALLHDLGKGTTPKALWPRHIAHEERGAKIVKKVCTRLRVPKEYCNLAILTARYHLNFHRVLELKPTTLVKILSKLDAFRRPQRFENFLLACEADARGRTGFENKHYPQSEFFRQAFSVANKININELRELGFENLALANKINEARISAVKNLKKTFSSTDAD